MEPAPSQNPAYPENQPTVWAVGAKGGLYTGLVFIIFGLIVFLGGFFGNQWLSNIFTLIAFSVGVYLTHNAYKEQGNGFMSYGQGLGLGAVVGLVSGILNAAFVTIYMGFIDPTLLQAQIQESIYQMEEQGLTDAQIEQAMQVSEMFTSPLAIFFLQIFSSLFFAFLVALVVSAFTKNTDPTAEY